MEELEITLENLGSWLQQWDGSIGFYPYAPGFCYTWNLGNEQGYIASYDDLDDLLLDINLGVYENLT